MTKVVLPESEFTDPREDCPHPEWWHAMDPQSTEMEVSELIGGLIRALQPEYVVETGTCFGVTAYMIGAALQLNGHGHLDTLEIDNDRADYCESHCSGLPVAVHRTKSLEFEPKQGIDFAFLDSETDLRVAEFEKFKPHLNPGAIVAFHDTGPHKGAYAEEVRKLPGVHRLQLRTPRGITLVQIPEE